ncbi:MAG TPA: Lpg1974 family pore-forming outer membrane protein [Gemmataceae bacterium]|nr:Lpg1974 family pore-forming outer membrane protein [Gemmataceae bacterium]
MARTACFLTALAFFAAAPLTPQGFAQQPQPAPAPPSLTLPPQGREGRVGGDASEYNPLPDLPRPPDQPASLLAPAPANPYEGAPLPGPYFERDPLLDSPEFPPPGWFADADMLITRPVVLNHLTNASIAGGAPDVVSLPSAPMDWTVAPRFEVGYTLPSGFGSIGLAYRFFVDEGTGAVMGFDAPAVLKSRLDINTVDLDYISRELTPWPLWNLTWRFGFRTGWIYFDSQADEPFAAAAAGSGVYELHTSDSFVGFGPHAGVLVDRGFQGTGLSLYGKSDFWINLGRINQGFYEVTTTPTPTGPLTEATGVGSGQSVPVLDLEAGLHWQPPRLCYTEFFLGWQYEYWWNAGRFSGTPDSRGSLFDQGVLLQAAFHY